MKASVKESKLHQKQVAAEAFFSFSRGSKVEGKQIESPRKKACVAFRVTLIPFNLFPEANLNPSILFVPCKIKSASMYYMTLRGNGLGVLSVKDPMHDLLGGSGCSQV